MTHITSKEWNALRVAIGLGTCFATTPMAVFAAPVITVSTPSQTVSSTYVQVNGVVSGAAKPMWYEVYQGSTASRMTDFGAFPQNANWFFIARHLSVGDNVVVVYAADSNNNISTARITLSISAVGKAAVRPRPHPAEVWWGGLGNNAQLQQNPADWMTVKKYADAYFFHTAAWGPQNDGLMQSIVQQEAPYGVKFVAELGGSTGTDPGWPQWEYQAWGAGGGFVSDRYNNTGLILSEATHDFHNNWPDFAAAYPNCTESQIDDTISTYWAQYFALNNAVYPHLKHAITNSPVWWSWNSFPSLNPNTESDQFSANGRNYSFSMAELMQDFRNKTAAQTGHTQWAFYSDFPWYTMVWDENPATAVGLTGTEGWVCREKVRNYELWLQGDEDNRHTAVCNEDVSTQAETDLAGANAEYYDKSLKSMYLAQREGHRPDRFLFESWYTYSGGSLPTIVTPEDATNSYTGIAKMAIKYIKGIKDSTGTLEGLSMAQSTVGSTTTIKLTNNGDIPCMPDLQSIETGDPTIKTQWLDPSKNDITAQMQTDEGWTYTPMLAPKTSISITCISTVPTPNAGKQIMVDAFWNPQDPTGVVRARVTVQLGSTSSTATTPAKITSIPSGVYTIVAKTTGNVLDCAGCANVDGAPIDLQAPTGQSCQQWAVTSMGNGLYSIRNLDANGSAGLSLDCTNCSPADGTPLELWDYWFGPCQQWQILQQSDTYFAIDTNNPKSSGNFDNLDGNGCSGAAGAKMILWSWGGGGCQQEWDFVPVQPAIVNGGAYTLTNLAANLNLNSGNASGTKVALEAANGAASQKWTMNKLSNGSYTIVDTASGLALSDPSGLGAGTLQEVLPAGGATSAEWNLVPAGNGAFSLVNVAKKLALDDPDSSTISGANLQIWNANGTAAQQWHLTPQ